MELGRWEWKHEFLHISATKEQIYTRNVSILFHSSAKKYIETIVYVK